MSRASDLLAQIRSRTDEDQEQGFGEELGRVGGRVASSTRTLGAAYGLADVLERTQFLTEEIQRARAKPNAPSIAFSAFPENPELQQLTGTPSVREVGQRMNLRQEFEAAESLEEGIANVKADLQKGLDKARRSLFIDRLKKPEDTPELKRLLETEGTTGVKEILDLATDPQSAVDLMADTLVPSALIMGASLLGSTGGLPGAVVSAFSASGNMEEKYAVLEQLSELDIDIFNIEDLVRFAGENPEKVAEIFDKATKKATGVGLLDAAAVGSGGVFLKGAKDAIKAGKVKNKLGRLALAGGYELATQGLLGAGGELLGSALAGDELDPDAAVLEFIGEIYGGGLGDITSGIIARGVDSRRKAADDGKSGETDEEADAEARLKTNTTLDEEVEGLSAAGQEAQASVQASLEESRLKREEAKAKKEAGTQSIVDEVTAEEQPAVDDARTLETQIAYLEGRQEVLTGRERGTVTRTLNTKKRQLAELQGTPQAEEVVEEAEAPATVEQELEQATDAAIAEEAQEVVETPAEEVETTEELTPLAEVLMTHPETGPGQRLQLAKMAGIELQPNEAGEVSFTREQAETIAKYLHANPEAAYTLEEGFEAEEVVPADVAEEQSGIEAESEVDEVEEAETAEDNQELQGIVDDVSVERGETPQQKQAVKAAAARAKAEAELEQELLKPLRGDGTPEDTDIDPGEVVRAAAGRATAQNRRVRRDAQVDLLNDALNKAKPLTHKLLGGRLKNTNWQIEGVDEDGRFIVTLRHITGIDEEGNLIEDESKFKSFLYDRDNRTTEFYDAPPNAILSKKTRTQGLAAKPNVLKALDVIFSRLEGSNARTFNNSPIEVEAGFARSTPEYVADKLQERTEQIENEEALTKQAKAADLKFRQALTKFIQAAGSLEGRLDPNRLQELKSNLSIARNDLNRLRGKLLRLRNSIRSEEEVKAEAENAQARTIESINAATQGQVVDASSRFPEREQEKGAGIVTLMTKEDFDAISKSDRPLGGAVQVLPDGSTRFIRLAAGKGDGSGFFDATIEGVSTGKLKDPVALGPTKFKVDARRISTLRQKAEAESEAAKLREQEQLREGAGALRAVANAKSKIASSGTDAGLGTDSKLIRVDEPVEGQESEAEQFISFENLVFTPGTYERLSQARTKSDIQKAAREREQFRKDLLNDVQSESEVAQRSALFRIFSTTGVELQALFTAQELRTLAKSLGLKSSGNKQVVADRLKIHARESIPKPTPSERVEPEETNEPSDGIVGNDNTISEMAEIARRRKPEPLDPLNPDEVVSAAEAVLQDKGVSKFVETPEGRAVLNVQYLIEIAEHLRKNRFSELTVDAVLQDVINGLSNPEVRPGFHAFRLNITKLREEDASLNEINESMEVRSQVAESMKDESTFMGKLKQLMEEGIGSMSGQDVEDAKEYYPGVTEFARTPRFLQEEQAAEPAEARSIEDIQAEIAALEAANLSDTLSERTRVQGTLTLPEGVEPRRFGQDNKLVTVEQMEEAVKLLQEKFQGPQDITSAAKLLTPDALKALGKVALFAVEGGARSLPEFTERMREFMGSRVDLFQDRIEDLFLQAMDTFSGGTRSGEDASVEALVEDYDAVLEQQAEASDMDGDAIAESERATPATEEELNAELKGERTPGRVAKESQTIPQDRVGAGERWALWSKPGESTASKALKRFLRTIRNVTRMTTQSSSTLPPSMRDATDLIHEGRAAVNSKLHIAQRFQGQYYQQLQKEGILNDKDALRRMNRAVVAYMEGMSASSSEKRFNVTLTQEMRDLVDRNLAAKHAISLEGKATGAFEGRINTAIDRNGRHYLHKSFRAIPAIRKLLTKATGGKTATESIPEVARKHIYQAALSAYQIPSDPKAIGRMPTSVLRGMIGQNRLVLAPLSKDKNDHELTLSDGTKVLLKQAEHAQLVDYVANHVPSEQQIINYTDTVIDGLFKPARIREDTAVSDSGDSSVTRERKLFLSEQQQIVKLINGLKRTKGVSPDIKRALAKNVDALKELSRAEFVTLVSSMSESAKAVLERSALEFQITDIVRAALGEITDPGALLADTSVRVASVVELSKALSNVIELGVETGEIVLGKANRDRSKHTHALGFKGRFTNTRSATVIPGLGNVRFSLDGDVFNVTDPSSGEPVVYGTEETINGIQDLLNARLALNNGAFISGMYRLSAAAKYDKVVGNPVAHPRNAVGSGFIGIGRGVVGSALNPFVSVFTDGGAFMLGSKLAVSELKASTSTNQAAKQAQKLLDEPTLANVALEVIRRGITHDSVRAGAMADLFAHFQTLSGEEFNLVMASQTWLTTNEQNALTSAADAGLEAVDGAVARASQIANEMFRLEDEAIKVVAFLQRTKQFMAIMDADTVLQSRKHAGQLLRDYFNPEKRSELSVEDLNRIEYAMDLAQENVIATFPTFSRAPELIKRLSRHPVFGSFPTFHAEMVRNNYNHMKFGFKLTQGVLPDGRKLTGKARARAVALGVGLLAQQSAWLLAQNVGVGAVNMLAIRHGEGELEGADPLEATTTAMLEAASNPMDAFNAVQYKNLMASYHRDTQIMVNPLSINPDNHSFGWVNIGWLSPEGGLTEAGYGFANDIARLAALEGSEEHKARMARQILNSFANRAMGIFGNEEVLFRELVDNFTERDGLTSENLQNPATRFQRNLNQEIREFLTGEDARLNPAELDQEGTSALVKGAAALITAVATSVPPNTAANQIVKAKERAFTVAEQTDNPANFAATLALDLGKTLTGIRYTTFKFDEDYPKTFAFTHKPALQNASRYMISELFDPKNDYTKEEFMQSYELLDSYRRQAFQSIASAYEMGTQVLGMSTAEMKAAYKAGNRDQEFSSVEGHTFSDIAFGNYKPLEITGARQRRVTQEWEEHDGPNTLSTRLLWLAEARTGAE